MLKHKKELSQCEYRIDPPSIATTNQGCINIVNQR